MMTWPDGFPRRAGSERGANRGVGGTRPERDAPGDPAPVSAPGSRAGPGVSLRDSALDSTGVKMGVH